jgi:hypothetical protein
MINVGKAYPNMEPAEIEVIRSFFEKYWELFAGVDSAPKCALIERKAVDCDSPPYNSYLGFVSRFSDEGIESCVEHLLQSTDHDTQINYDVKPEYLTVVNLPEYKSVH